MADGLNRWQGLGYLGADPELRWTQSGQAVLNMRLATTESYLDKDKVRRERCDWHNVVVWGKRAEGLAKILYKGSSLFVEGSMRTSSYDDRDGNKRYKTEVVANNVLLTGGRGQRHDDAPGDEHDPRRAHEDGDYDGGQPPGTPHRTQTPAAGYAGQRQAGGRPAQGGAQQRQRREEAPPPPTPPTDDYDGGAYGGGSDDDLPF